MNDQNEQKNLEEEVQNAPPCECECKDCERECECRESAEEQTEHAEAEPEAPQGEPFDPIRTTIKTSKDDFRELMYFNLFYRRSYMMVAIVLFAILSCVVIGQGVFFGGEKDLLFMVCLFFLITLVMLFVQVELTSKKFGKSGAELSPERDYIIDREGIKSTLADGTVGCAQWGVFREAYETDRQFFFFASSRQALVVGKRYLAPGDAERLRKLVFDSMGKRFKIKAKLEK